MLKKNPDDTKKYKKDGLFNFRWYAYSKSAVKPEKILGKKIKQNIYVMYIHTHTDLRKAAEETAFSLLMEKKQYKNILNQTQINIMNQPARRMLNVRKTF